MTRYTPLWEQQGSYAASVDRRLIAALWPAGASTGGAVSVGGGMTVNVAAGTAAVPTPNNTGSVLCAWDATETVTVTPAPAGGSNRYDLIIVRPRGNDLDGGANNDFILDYVTGAAAATPTVPATPAGTVVLAQIYIPGGSAAVTAGNITDVRPGGLAVPGASTARGFVAVTTGPASQTDVTTAATAVVSAAAALVAGRRYRVTGQCLSSQQTATGNPIVALADSASYIPVSTARLVSLIALGAGQAAPGCAVWTFVATATATVTFSINGQSSAGALRFGVNSSQIIVEDIGT